MADQLDRTGWDKGTKVPQSVIDEIMQLGMENAIKKAKSGTASPEFIEGIRRFYPNVREDVEAAGHSVAPDPRNETPEVTDSATQGGGRSVSEGERRSNLEGEPSPNAVSRRLQGGVPDGLMDLAKESPTRRAMRATGAGANRAVQGALDLGDTMSDNANAMGATARAGTQAAGRAAVDRGLDAVAEPIDSVMSLLKNLYETKNNAGTIGRAAGRAAGRGIEDRLQ